MANIFEVEHVHIAAMDKVCDKLGIEWRKGGQEIRGVLINAVNAAYHQGKFDEALYFKKICCKHDYDYSRTGGVCRKCGATTGQCSSD